MPVALEIEDRVHHVLERARAGDRAALRHVPDEVQHVPVPLGVIDQPRGRFAHLADAARRRRQLRHEDHLDGIHDDHLRPHALDLLKDRLDARLREQQQLRRRDPQPLGADLRLQERLLRGHVEHLQPGRRDAVGRLEQQRGLPDPRIAADQHRRSEHRAAAEDAVELLDPGQHARRVHRLDFRDRRRLARGERRLLAHRLRDDALLGQRIPLLAIRAPPRPARLLRPALLADVNRLRLRHRISSRAQVRCPARTCQGETAERSA